MPTTPALRIAILINSPKLLEWQYQMLKQIQQSGDGEIVLAVVRGEAKKTNAAPEKNSLAKSLFYRYANWDRKKFKQTPNPFDKRTLAELEGSIPIISMTPEVTLWSDSLCAEDIAVLREKNIDVVVRLGWRILKGEVLSFSRCGVWSFHHGDNQVNRGGPPGVWEHFLGHSCTGVTLQVLSKKLDDGLVLDRSHTATDRSSVSKTRNKLYWRSIDMLPRKLTELRHLGYNTFTERARKNNPSIGFYSQPLFSEKKMTLRQVLYYIGKNLYSYSRKAIFDRMFEEKWVLYYKLGDDISTSLWQFSKIESPNDRYWADPHIIKRDGTFYIFVEEYIYKTSRGRIAVIPVSEDGTVGEVKTALETDYHLSYPFVFEHDGETYMIPETGANRSVDLYRCVQFPDKWEHKKTLMEDVRAVDTTLFQHNDRWWMFTNKCDTQGGNTHDELHLFSADSFLDDNWIPHPQRVIVSDSRCARPAGALFRKNGKLYRPAQDCSVDYGYALQLQEIKELSEECYREVPVSRITPDWNARVQGVHTLNHVDGMTVVDAKVYIKKSLSLK